MTSESCDRISNLLVDYSDGELPEKDCARVESHLSGCGDCRSRLQRLQESLRLAQSIWHEVADQAEATLLSAKSQAPVGRRWTGRLPTVESNASVRGSARRVQATVALGACAAAALLAVGVWIFSPNRARDEIALPAKIEQPDLVDIHDAASTEAKPPPDDADVDAIINREFRSARLAATVQFLAAEPSLKGVHDQAERYLARAYPGMPAGHSPAERKPSIPNKEPES